MIPFLPLFLSATLSAQTPSSAVNPSVPLTRVLAIGRLTKGTTRDRVMPVMNQEVRDTVRLYLAGKLDQWYSRKDENGVVFVLNVQSVSEAHELLEKLPLGQNKLMEFDLIPLGPLNPLSILVSQGADPTR